MLSDDRRPIASHLLLIIIVISAIGVASVSVTARAPPEPVCGVCTQALNQAADDHDVNLERGTSKMTVQVHPNGTATFTAWVSLIRGADRLRNVTLRRSIVRDVSYIVTEERRNLRTQIDRNTLVIRYRAAVAHQSLGVVRFDAFETSDAPLLGGSGGEGTPYSGADTLVMRAPVNYSVHNGHGDSANDTTIVWEGDSHEQYAGHIKDDIVISFTPADAIVPAIRVKFAALLDWFRLLV